MSLLLPSGLASIRHIKNPLLSLLNLWAKMGQSREKWTSSWRIISPPSFLPSMHGPFCPIHLSTATYIPILRTLKTRIGCRQSSSSIHPSISCSSSTLYLIEKESDGEYVVYSLFFPKRYMLLLYELDAFSVQTACLVIAMI